MGYAKQMRSAEISTSSMADIAFLLLTFFLMTTVIKDEKGLTLLLPPHQEGPLQEIPERNLYTIQLNAADELLVEKERRSSLDGLKNEIKLFILNNGSNPSLSDSPQAAIVSLKTSRGTSHAAFIATLDEIQGAYYEIYAERAGMTSKQFRFLDLDNPLNKDLYNKARNGIPMNISIAEPTN